MDVYSQRAYRELEEVLEKHRKMKSNLLVVTVPGVGTSHLLKAYVERCEKLGNRVAYISDYDYGGKWEDLNIVDLGKNFDLAKVEKMMMGAKLDQKMVLVISRPSLVKDGSYLATHTYERFYVGVLDSRDAEALIDERGMVVDEKIKKRLYEVSGGIAKIYKYFLINSEKLDWKIDKLVNDEGLARMVEEVVGVCRSTSEEILEKLGIKKKGVFVSWLLSNWKGEGGRGINIQVDFDLGFSEDGKKSAARLTPEEKKIIEKMVSNAGRITKEEVSEIKWGEGRYDKFSDQAINKAMRRLGKKLQYYRVETVVRVGYKLIRG